VAKSDDDDDLFRYLKPEPYI